MTPEEDLYEKLRGLRAARPTAPSEGSAAEQEIKASADVSEPLNVRSLFHHQDAHPIVINMALLKAFGLDWLGWESETIWAEIKRVFQASMISELCRAKIQTVKTCQVSDLPWKKWQVFEKIVQGLNNNVPRFDIMQAPGLEQLYVAIDILEGIRKDEFSDEVKLYMAAAMLHEDVTYVPDPLSFIQDEVSQPHYVCRDCGNEDSALFHDGVCDTCTKKWTHGAPLSGRPDADLVRMGKGKNTYLVLRHDPDKVQQLWETVKTKPTKDVADHLEETPEGTQVAKLLVARDYMNVRRRQLADQLTTLKTWLGAS